MRRTNVKIRGIYTTALTRLFVDMGFGIAQPSCEIRERFQIPAEEATEDISIVDRDDRQGIRIFGKRALVEEVIQRLWDVFLDVVVRKKSPPEGTAGAEEARFFLDVEFPGATKTLLDSLRARVLPTFKNHHRLRVIASDYLDLIEREIERAPHRQAKLEREFLERFLYQPLRKEGIIRFEHVKPEGETLNLQEGEIVTLERKRLVVRRRFQKGRYDGLDLPIEAGDYGITELQADAWFLRHRYFSKAGSLKGEYWNLNTPIELYPGRIRYVDLHVDVVRRGKEAPRIIDQEKLESIAREGLISPRLQQKALELSKCLLDQMNGSDQ